MYNHIILSSYLFGSFYLFSISLTLTNRALLEHLKIPSKLFIINGLTMLLSGSIVVYNFSLLNSCHFHKLWNLRGCKIKYLFILMKEFVLYILYYDFFYYFLHRLLHTRLFYKIHKIHHLNIKPKYRDYYSVHILEVPFTSFGLFLAVYIHKLYIYQLICSVIFINIRGMLEHDDSFIVLVGDHHLKHHLLFTCNYGEYWLDFIFGTLYKNSTNQIR